MHEYTFMHKYIFMRLHRYTRICVAIARCLLAMVATIANSSRLSNKTNLNDHFHDFKTLLVSIISSYAAYKQYPLPMVIALGCVCVYIYPACVLKPWIRRGRSRIYVCVYFLFWWPHTALVTEGLLLAKLASKDRPCVHTCVSIVMCVSGWVEIL